MGLTWILWTLIAASFASAVYAITALWWAKHQNMWFAIAYTFLASAPVVITMVFLLTIIQNDSVSTSILKPVSLYFIAGPALVRFIELIAQTHTIAHGFDTLGHAQRKP